MNDKSSILASFATKVISGPKVRWLLLIEETISFINIPTNSFIVDHMKNHGDYSLGLTAVLIASVILISGCTQTQTGRITAEEGIRCADGSIVESTDLCVAKEDSNYESSYCDKEAEAHREADSALSYCKSHPYGTYRGSVCGVPVTIHC